MVNIADKIFNFLRSAFRLKCMQDTFMPEPVISLEKKIFSERLSKLNPSEVLEVLSYWNDYLKNSLEQQEVEDNILLENIDHHLSSLK